MYDTINTKSTLSKKAEKVGTIFDVIGWVILIIGGTAAVLTMFGTLFASFGDDGMYVLSVGIPVTIGIAIYTAVMWASVSLATIVAQYIASKS